MTFLYEIILLTQYFNQFHFLFITTMLLSMWLQIRSHYLHNGPEQRGREHQEYTFSWIINNNRSIREARSTTYTNTKSSSLCGKFNHLKSSVAAMTKTSHPSIKIDSWIAEPLLNQKYENTERQTAVALKMITCIYFHFSFHGNCLYRITRYPMR